MNEFLHLGFDSYINVAKVRLIADIDSDKLRREMQKREMDKNSKMFWNASNSKKIKSIVLCDDGMIIVSALNAETLVKRFNDIRKGIN